MQRLGNTSIGFCALKSLDWCLLGWGGPCRHSSHIRWFHNLGDTGKEGNKYIQINAAFTKININKQFTWEHPSASKLKYFPPINPVTRPRDVSRAARIFPRHTEISASLCSTLRQLQTVKNDGATLEIISHAALGKPGPWAGLLTHQHTCGFQPRFRVDHPVPHLAPYLSLTNQTQDANILRKDKPNNSAVTSIFSFSPNFFLNTALNPNGILGFCFNGEARICWSSLWRSYFQVSESSWPAMKSLCQLALNNSNSSLLVQDE